MDFLYYLEADVLLKTFATVWESENKFHKAMLEEIILHYAPGFQFANFWTRGDVLARIAQQIAAESHAPQGLFLGDLSDPNFRFGNPHFGRTLVAFTTVPYNLTRDDMNANPYLYTPRRSMPIPPPGARYNGKFEPIFSETGSDGRYQWFWDKKCLYNYHRGCL